ncbi:restriction endonuclease subunit S [Rosistilla oblonga]|uniref:EcoKI restriction-modification system protein HsdS n=1 Tax=Rosistilla oblonga TaxID=2527990 RepID=A0A518IVF1_9BACT|nr:restriction endonuclease subunit S [Rosistilla oblonga]QDV57066.1 EcoKI restriction-modification system protein HsdS [Rosistilla oblonga]
MATYPEYPEYKLSDETWLGKIPVDWELIRIGHLSPVKRGASPRPIEAERYFDDEGEYAWTRISDVTASDMYLNHCPERLSDLGSSLSVKLQPGELFLSIAATVGKPCITAIKACIHDGFVYFPQLNIPNKFLFYVFTAGHAYAGLGKMGTQLNLNTETVSKIKIALGTPEEVKTIVQFLDYETAKIDALIEKQQQLIALLDEKRQAVISHAVTKGLNPDAPMRDSGIEWLGEVPEHWTVCRIKQIAKRETGHTPSKKVDTYWVDCEIPWVSLNDTGQLKHVDFISETAICINEKGMANSSAHLLPPGCVVFTRDASIGLAAITSREMAVSQHVIAWDCDPEIVNNEYLLLVFYAMEAELERFTFGATLKTIGMPDVNRLTGAFPPLQEQADIVKHVFSTKEKLSASIEKAEKLLDILEERRTALISAAVTGKIDVRGWKPPSTAAQQETEMEVA